jgi:hypothetical protein
MEVNAEVEVVGGMVEVGGKDVGWGLGGDGVFSDFYDLGLRKDGSEILC